MQVAIAVPKILQVSHLLVAWVGGAEGDEAWTGGREGGREEGV
jgi:hypothetical protein